MALLFMDGFDAGDFAMKWRTTSASTSAGGRFGTGRYISGGTINYDFPTAVNRIYSGFAVSCSSISPSAGGVVVYIYGDARATTHLTVWLKQDGISLMRGSYGGTVIGSAAGLFTTSTFYYLEVSATISDTVGNCEVRLNGSTVINYTGDTKNAGTNTTIDGIGFTQNSNTISVDDFWLLDDSGSAPHNNFLGDVRVYTISPSAAGNTTQFTPSSGANYTTVDELPYSATDYVSGSTPTTKDTYAMGDLPAGATTIYGVQTNIIAKKTDAGNIAIKPIVRSSTTDYAGTTVALSSSDTVIRDLRTLDPATSTAWTSSGVNNMEAGMEIA